MKPAREKKEPYMKKVNGVTYTTNIKVKWNSSNYYRFTYNCPSTLNVELI